MASRIKQNENGFAHLLIVGVIVIIVAIIGIVGWQLTQHRASGNKVASTTGNSKAMSNTSSTSSCMTTYHDSNLCNFASTSANFTKTAYTASIALTQQDGTNSTMTLQSDCKGNTVLNGNSGGQQLSTIELNNVAYIQTGGTGPWIEYPSGASTPSTNPTTNMNIGVGSAGIAYKSLSKTSCGSLSCYEY